MTERASRPRPRRLKTVELPPGGRVGRYTLCYRLARGGMGAVYLARMAGPGRFAKLLAVKLIHPHLVDQPEVVEMFLEEAQLQSRVNHPNVCAVTDFGHHEANYFMAMEYLEGETLEDFAKAIAARPELQFSDLWISVAARIVMEACEGLHAAHELRGEGGEPMGFVHRDVSPANLFVTYAGATKVMDFGVATSSESQAHTMPGANQKGRYNYMSPERARSKDYDRRVDVWSLGVILWELLAFKSMYRRPNPAQVLMAVAHDEPPSILDEREDVPPEIVEILGKALARDPDDRYATARDMGRDLHRMLARMPDPVGPAEVAELMESVFSERIRERRQIAQHARQIDSGKVMSVADDPGSIEAVATDVGAEAGAPATKVMPMEAVDSGVRVAGLLEGAHEADELVGEATIVQMPDASLSEVLAREEEREAGSPVVGAPSEPAVDEAEPARRRPVGMVLLAVVAFVGALGAGLWAGVRMLEPEPTTEAAPPPPRADAPTPAVEGGEEPPDPETPPTDDEGETPLASEADVAEVAPPTEAIDAAEEPDEAAGEPAGEESDGEDDEAASEEEADSDPEAGSPEPSARARRRPTGPPGTLAIVTPGGWALVFENRRQIGRTPGTIPLSPGRHVLYIRPRGTGDPIRRVVRVRSGERVPLSVPIR